MKERCDKIGIDCLFLTDGGGCWSISHNEDLRKVSKYYSSIVQTPTDRETLQKALDIYGSDAQTLMVFEEMSELQKELCKHARGKDNVDQIAEEIADVQIMLEQMIILHDCEDAVKAFRKSKIERLKRRMEGGND